jgi:hypothetical protein
MTLSFIAEGILLQEARPAASSAGYCDINRFERPWICAINMITVPTVLILGAGASLAQV